MNKIGKFFVILLIVSSLSSSNFIGKRTKTIDVFPDREMIANYNEVYGIKETIKPQIRTTVEKNSSLREVKYLAVFVAFADSSTLVSNHLDDDECLNNAMKLLNGNEFINMTGPNGVIQVPSFKKYYEMQSYGKLSITTEIFPRENGEVVTYKDSHPMGYYLAYSDKNPDGYKDKSESLKRETALINSAIAAVSDDIEAAGVNPEEIDTGGDGIVDAISFFIEGADVLSSPVAWGDLLWSHKLDNYGITEKILGKQVISYNLLYTYDYTSTAGLFSLNRGTYATIMHEYGHTLGFVDLYRFDYSGAAPVGFYDIMGSSSGSNPQNFLTYFTSEYQADLNWHDEMPIVNETTRGITLHKPQFVDASEKRAVKLQVDASSDEFFVVEYHAKQNTYDTYAADASGIIVYRVNEKNKYSGNKEGGDHGELDHIFVFRPGETNLGAGAGNLSQATLNMNRNIKGKTLGSAVGFDNETIYYSNGVNSGIVIQVTGETEDSVTFDVIFPDLQGNGTIDDPFVIDTPELFLYAMSNDTSGKYYRLIEDLDFNNVGDYPSITFLGTLDGNGKTIANVKSSTGIFDTLGDYMVHAHVENLFIENITATSQTGNYLGGVVSNAENVTLKNVHLLSGRVTNVESIVGNTAASTGGFAGKITREVFIDNCSSSIEVRSPVNVGGFIGMNMNGHVTNSYTTSNVAGEKNVGEFIGLQYITESNYNTPDQVFYIYREGTNAVGGAETSVHNVNTLPMDELDRGIIGVKIAEQEMLYVDGSKSFAPQFVPNVKAKYTITSEDDGIAKYENETLRASSRGTTYVYTDIQVGDIVMRSTTKVTVIGEGESITEKEILDYFGLTKRENYLFGFNLGESIESILQKFANNHFVDFIRLSDSNDQEIISGIIATGMKMSIRVQNIEYDYTIVIKGDANGDGLIYATDYVKIKNQIMGKPTLEGAYYLAADIDNDGNIYATDYVKIKNYIMGRGEIPQK